jgi:hypothetical protein
LWAANKKNPNCYDLRGKISLVRMEILRMKEDCNDSLNKELILGTNILGYWSKERGRVF